MKRFGVYTITNTQTNRIYIGITAQNFKARWAVHQSSLRRGAHHNVKLQEDWRRYGEDTFKFQVLEFVENSRELYMIERSFIWSAVENGVDLYNIYDPEDFQKAPKQIKQPTAVAPVPLDITQTIYGQKISHWKCKQVGQSLREMGYSIADSHCESTPLAISEQLEPRHTDRQLQLCDYICQVAGLKPKRS